MRAKKAEGAARTSDVLQENSAPASNRQPAPARKRRSMSETRYRLMIAAEELVATRGMAALSAREVAKKAGLRNNVSVQYHFGSMANMLIELVEFRQTQLETLRAQAIEREAHAIADCDMYTLLKMFLLPHLALARREDGGIHHASFLFQYLPTFTVGEHPFRGDSEEFPVLRGLISAIRRKMDYLDPVTIDWRTGNAAMLFLNVIHTMPHAAFEDHHMIETGELIKDTLLQCVGVLTAGEVSIKEQSQKDGRAGAGYR